MATSVQDGASYVFMNAQSKTVIDLDNGSSENHTKVQGWTPFFDPNDTFHQNGIWKVEHVGDDFYTLTNQRGGTAIDLENGSADNGTTIQCCDRDPNNPNQAWKIEKVSASDVISSYTITNKASGTVIDLAGGDSTEGTRIQGYENNGGLAQRWILLPVDV